VNILSLLLSYVLLYKYVAIGFALYLSAIIVPLPANAMMLAMGAFASQGYLDFWFTLMVAVVAFTLGDLTDYGLTRRYGERVTRLLRLDKAKFYQHLQKELRTDAAITVFLTRFAGSLSSITNFLAGLVGVPFQTFFAMDLIANIIEPLGALGLGFVVGDYWGDYSNQLELLTSIIAVSVILFILARIYQRAARRTE